MAQQLRRLADDVIQTWHTMPKSQALRWYGAVLQNAPTVLRERKFYSADHAMRGVLRFRLLGRDLNIDVNSMNTTGGKRLRLSKGVFCPSNLFSRVQTA